MILGDDRANFVMDRLVRLKEFLFRSYDPNLISLQTLAFPHELVAVFFQLEFLDLSARGFGVVVDPEDVLGYCADSVLVSCMLALAS